MRKSQKEYKDKYYAAHKAEINEKNRLRDLAHPERVRMRKRRHHLKCYGLTLAQYDEMYILQDGKCAICGTPSDDFNIDHNHTTGVARGLLCRFCNLGIGNLRDDVKLVRLALKYLEERQ
jgi:hypothetical protein